VKLRTLATATVFLVLLAATGAHWLGGPAAAFAALICGSIAGLTQLGAARLARRSLAAGFSQLLGAWGLGIGLRFAGVVALALLTLALPARFPPLPSAFGFLAVLLPLLFLELRLTR
jgi:hypothetical protein